jgi:stringent starvation protein B
MREVSTQPYFMRAIYEWCTDQGYTPYISVQVNGAVKVPMEFVKNGNIVLNIAFSATSGLLIDNEAVKFKARFGGTSREIYVPIENVLAIFASENGQGMSFQQIAFEDEVEDEIENDEAIENAIDAEDDVDEGNLEANSPVLVEVEKPEASQNKNTSPESEKKFKKPSLTIVK